MEIETRRGEVMSTVSSVNLSRLVWVYVHICTSTQLRMCRRARNKASFMLFYNSCICMNVFLLILDRYGGVCSESVCIHK